MEVLVDDITTWNCVYFANYWQNDTNKDGAVDHKDKKQPIKWCVLSVNGNNAFLLVDQNLDVQPYNTENNVDTWETCTLRGWLNPTFYQQQNNGSKIKRKKYAKLLKRKY